MKLDKIPATVVTGFLGSGKTTLLANLLRQANGQRIAVIVNEFGELDIDADLLRSCPLDCDDETTTDASAEQGIYELANGCICCTVEEEFLPVMEQLVERRDDIDHILIETSGLALPKPLVQAFNWPQVKQYCTVDSVITVVDGPAMIDGRIAHDPQQVAAQRAADDSLDHDPSLQELLDDQLSSADLIIISKADLLSAAQLDEVRERLRPLVKPEVKFLPVQEGQVDRQLIMGLGFNSEDNIETLHTHHDHHHEHGHHHHHAHDDFTSLSINLGTVDEVQLVARLRELLASNAIYRIKGFLALPDKPMRRVIHAVGDRIDQYFDRPWRADESPASKLVLIGKDLDQASLADALRSAEISADNG